MLFDKKNLRNRIKKLFLLSFMYLFFTGHAFSQSYLPYYHLVNEARWQSFKKNHAVADSLYQAAFLLVDYIQPEHSLDAATNAMAFENAKSCYEYSLQSLLNGMHWEEIKKIDKFPLTEWFLKLQLQKDSIESVFLERSDKYWREIVDSMIVRDQFDRAGGGDQQKKYDSINLCIIKEQIKKHGKMPGLREIGYDGVDKLNVIFRHIDQRYRLDSLAHVIIQQSLYGDFSPEIPAIFIDHACWFDADLPYYFTRAVFGQLMLSRGESILVPFRNRDCVDKIRYELGLMPLERMIEMNDIKVYTDEEFEERFKGLFMTTPPRRPFIINCDISEL
jgi:hypothetical protein